LEKEVQEPAIFKRKKVAKGKARSGETASGGFSQGGRIFKTKRKIGGKISRRRVKNLKNWEKESPLPAREENVKAFFGKRELKKEKG